MAKYVPDSQEQATLDRYNERVKKAPPATMVKVGGVLRVEIFH